MNDFRLIDLNRYKYQWKIRVPSSRALDIRWTNGIQDLTHGVDKLIMTVNQGRYHLHRSLAPGLMAAMLTLLVCCSAPKTMPESKPYAPVRTDEAPAQVTSNADTASAMEQQIRAVVDRWSGTPHKMGGNDIRN